MASDRSPFSKRLKSLAQRAGRPSDEPGAERTPAVAIPPENPVPNFPPAEPVAPVAAVPPPADETPDDEQPTGDVPVIAEQPTTEQPAVVVPPAERTGPVLEPVAEPIDPDADAPGEPAGPTLAPPVVPPRPVDEPQPAPAGEAPADEDDDLPFSGSAPVWPQSAPTPRFEPADEDATIDAPAVPQPVVDSTFPEPSPAPIEGDVPAPVDEHAQAAAIPEPEVTGFTTELNTADVAAINPDDLPEPDPRTDATTEQPALSDTGRISKDRVLGGLRKLRSGRHDKPSPAAGSPLSEVPQGAATPTPTPTTIPAPTPEPDELPQPIATGGAAAHPTPAPTPYEPPAKPSFSERAALRRRSKSLRARRDAGLLELGAIVLDQRRFGDPTGGSLMRRRTDELADLDSELAAIEQVLDDDGPAETVAQLGIVRCLTCTSLVGPRDRFCVQCGAPRPEDAPPSAS